MDNEVCDRHPEAWAKARLTLPSGGVLYLCGHCAHALPLSGEYVLEYEAVSV